MNQPPTIWYGWSNLSNGKYYHRLKERTNRWGAKVWHDCNSWPRTPRPEPPFPSSGIKPCPRCFRTG
jgi:hypothetical protein